MMEPLCCLFIDDDTFMQRAFVRMAQRIRPGWVFISEEHPTQWQQQLGDKVPDIVVSDFLMPGTRGDKLLQQVAERYPQAVRVLLTGDTRDDVIGAASTVAHYVIGKPYQQQALVDLFDGVDRLIGLPLSEQERALLSRAGGVVPRTEVLKDFERAILDPDVSIKQVVNILGHESEIAGKLIQLANSPFMGFQRQTLSLEEAIKRLGLVVTQAVVTTLAVARSDSICLDEHLHKSLSDRIFAAATFARELAEKMVFSHDDMEFAFTATLLKGLGELCLASPKFTALLNQQPQGIPLSAAMLAAYLLTLWGYPSSFVNVLVKQPLLSVASLEENCLASIVFVADLSGTIDKDSLADALSVAGKHALAQAVQAVWSARDRAL